MADNGYDLADSVGADDFDSPPVYSPPADVPAAAKEKRPEPERDSYGRYRLPVPGKRNKQSWQRVSTLIKMASDTYHLDQWKLRSAVKGVALRPDLTASAAMLDVKADKNALNDIVTRAMDAAGATAMASVGTAMHKMAETVDETGSMDGVPEAFRPRMVELNAALAARGITLIPGFIERITVSEKYGVAGTLDRGYRLADGSYVVGDLKTGSSIDYEFKTIEAQLAAYQDGVNTAGVWTGKGWDTSIKLRSDIGIVVHLPSDSQGCEVYVADLSNGRRLLAACVAVREERKHKSPMRVYEGAPTALPVQSSHDFWLRKLAAATTRGELIKVAEEAKRMGDWTEELSVWARSYAEAIRRMG